ncbi:MAG: glycosyltransferase family 2 protein [Legionellaceae bacterium]|nr:glycosyltransferase family 2 protein [Legionellaceae bacterium]
MDPVLRIAVVIPAYKVCNHIIRVISQIGPEVTRIYVIDDACPESSGELVESICQDPRVMVIKNAKNQGVGAAVMRGYQAAIEEQIDIIVKIDGDGQMDPALLLDFVGPIAMGEADYTKGNRFFDLENIRRMPLLRLCGNSVLSFMTKLSSGYWNLFDPTNGYTAIHREVAQHLPFKKISQRYFFETDMLFRLNILNAVVMDIPIDAQYADEKSNLKISKIMGEFLRKHLCNFAKRIFYNYYLRGMSLASIELPIGVLMLLVGVFYGGAHWLHAARLGVASPAGTVMLSALLVILGMQFILAFIGYDVASVPQRPLHKIRRSYVNYRNKLKQSRQNSVLS